jgi:hypothetical protein
VSTPASQGSEPVVIELPSANLDPARRLNGTISECAGKRLIITSPEKITVASAIRVQGKDLLFLGDVLQSDPIHDGQWSVHMTVKRKFMIF